MTTPPSLSRYIPNPTPCGRSRRQFLWEVGGGFAGLGLIDLLSRSGFFSGSAQAADPAAPAQPYLMSPKPPHFPTKAKHVVFLFMNARPSQVDTFDPAGAQRSIDGTAYSWRRRQGRLERPPGRPLDAESPFLFSRHGQSGCRSAALFRHTARFSQGRFVRDPPDVYRYGMRMPGCLADEHGQRPIIGKPSMGLLARAYGLGTESESLPSFVVMTDRRVGPIGRHPTGASASHAGRVSGHAFRGKGSACCSIWPRSTGIKLLVQQRHESLDLIQNPLNRGAPSDTSRLMETELAARIQSYELLAFKMQTTATEVVDLEREDARTRAMYGLDSERTRDFGGKCLLARRLLERGVRFIQLYSGGGHLEDTWDGHADCIKNHTTHAGETDQPVAALLADLKRTGVWDETLVVWGGEFGRTPTSEGINKPGRDHNPFGFSMWLAGAGVKGGQAIGATDELGFNAVENRCHVADLHATILHTLMGLDHTRLTYFYQGFDYRLTGVRGQVIKGVLT